MIGTPAGTRVLSVSSEREAAGAAETILRQIPKGALPAPVWIVCSNASIRRRLTSYFMDVQTEIAGFEANFPEARKPASPT